MKNLKRAKSAVARNSCGWPSVSACPSSAFTSGLTKARNTQKGTFRLFSELLYFARPIFSVSCSLAREMENSMLLAFLSPRHCLYTAISANTAPAPPASLL